MKYTDEQLQTLAWLYVRGYRPERISRTVGSVVVVTVKRKLTRGLLSLSIAPSGMYLPTNGPLQFSDMKRQKQWQILK